MVDNPPLPVPDALAFWYWQPDPEHKHCCGSDAMQHCVAMSP